jgi:hypothetical protein
MGFELFLAPGASKETAVVRMRIQANLNDASKFGFVKVHLEVITRSFRFLAFDEY